MDRSYILSNHEFRLIICDTSKVIEEDIKWTEDEDHSPAVEFRANLASRSGISLFVQGSYNCLARTLSYAIISPSFGRIYALDLGKDHRNPCGKHVGEKHKHRWTEQYKDKEAYRPDDITCAATNPVGVWREFCSEAKIQHCGTMSTPPSIQMELFI